MRELAIILEEIRIKSEKDYLIMKMKKEIRFKERTKHVNMTGSNAFLLCNNELLYAKRIVIPASLQNHMQKKFPIGHLRICWMKYLMRCYTYWPKIDQEIENLIEECKCCALVAKAPPIKF